MERGCTVVLDVGKTNTKLTLWDEAGHCLARQERRNALASGLGFKALDLAGTEAWTLTVLGGFARLALVRTIVPVTHGAAAVLVHGDQVFAPPMDYEDEAPAAPGYEAQRDPFAVTGSPSLPAGLNLGRQLDRLQRLTGPWPDDLRILLWPQYWAWRMSGVMASEVSSLGCHSDLWRPYEHAPSALSMARGWAGRLGPLRRAGEVLGPISREWARLTGLPDDCLVLCGLHDSNAALLAARGHPEIAAHDATVLSTGTWFVAMRSLGADAPLSTLDEARDCLVNVDVEGRPVPSARFMGGREAELIAGLDSFHLTDNYDPAALIGSLPRLIERGVFAYPSFAPGTGPFPGHAGRWANPPDDAADRRAVLGLYLALMADQALALIGSRDRLLIEGRFAEAEVFVRALATLRPRQKVYVSNAQDDVPYGALRLIDPDLKPASALKPVAPLDIPLDDYGRRWLAGVAA